MKTACLKIFANIIVKKRIDFMSKQKLVNILRALCVLIVLISLIIFTINFKNLPAKVGSHFGPGGNFDTYREKKEIFWIFYPYFVSFFYIMVFEIANILINKMKTGLEITEKQENQLKFIVNIVFTVLKYIIILFYSCFWAYAVGTQSSINTKVGVTFVLLMVALIFGLLIFFLYMTIRYKYIPKLKKIKNKQ